MFLLIATAAVAFALLDETGLLGSQMGYDLTRENNKNLQCYCIALGKRRTREPDGGRGAGGGALIDLIFSALPSEASLKRAALETDLHSWLIIDISSRECTARRG